jgi:hypothetical protein
MKSRDKRIMNISIKMIDSGNPKGYSKTPFSEIKQAWKQMVGKFTVGGDYVESIHDVYETEFILNIIARDPKTIEYFGGERRLTICRSDDMKLNTDPMPIEEIKLTNDGGDTFRT